MPAKAPKRAKPALERRKAGDRRNGERRVFPPRPELRRKNDGRRRGDPQT
jgi:hypothetical protein